MTEVYAVMVVNEKPLYSEVTDKIFSNKEEALLYAKYLSTTYPKTNTTTRIIVERFDLQDTLESALPQALESDF